MGVIETKDLNPSFGVIHRYQNIAWLSTQLKSTKFPFQRSSRKSQIWDFSENTVDGRNPAPVDSEFIPLFPFFVRVSIIRTRESHGVPTVLLVTRVPGHTGDAGLLLPGEPYRRGCRCAGAQAGLRLEGGDG